MRIALAIAVAFACPLAAAAQDAGDRYGPWSSARVQSAADAQSPVYEGRILSWSNKQAPQAPAVQDQQRAPSRPEPMALAGRFSRGLPPAPAVYRAPPQSSYVPFQPQVPLPMQQVSARTAPPAPFRAAPAPTPVPAARPLPTSLYEAPPRMPELLGGPPPKAQARPQQVAAIAPVPVAAPAPTPGVGGATRYYSVHRGYGLTPDAIPEPPAGNRYVLIGPPDGAPEPKPRSDDDNDDAPAGRPAF